MSLLTKMLHVAAKEFGAPEYPAEAYEDLVGRIRLDDGPILLDGYAVDLAEDLSLALAWKAGQIRMDPWVLDDAPRQYSATSTKQTPEQANHLRIFQTSEFLEWARSVGQDDQPRPERVDDLCGGRFGVFAEGSVVDAAFVLHCLAPETYPLMDQHVVAAFYLLASARNPGLKDSTMTKRAYDFYLRWRKILCREDGCAGSGLDSEDFERRKPLDAGLWVVGRRLRARPETTVEEPAVENARQPMAALVRQRRQPGLVTTASPEFKQRVMELAKTMTQAQAMAAGAREFGIDLPPSYLQYPGSHIDRWRGQGFG